MKSSDPEIIAEAYPEWRHAVLERLLLVVQRLLDAEIVAIEVGDALITEAKAACHSLKLGDLSGTHQHVEHLAHITEALITTRSLRPLDGTAIIDAANEYLNQKADGSR